MHLVIYNPVDVLVSRNLCMQDPHVIVGESQGDIENYAQTIMSRNKKLPERDFLHTYQW